MAMEWKVAFPLHPEYRTLPMVWYVPPLSPIYLANLLTAGDEEPIAACLERMLAMRAYMRAKTIERRDRRGNRGAGRPEPVARSRTCIM
jgi:nitrate reductase beta subunit